jgi:uncharacterized phiE125 gp8 family phage protein
MALVLVTAPQVEPVDLDAAKLHLRETIDDRDEEIEGFITAARERVETETNRALMSQVWQLVLPCFPDTLIEIPKPPLLSVTSVTYRDAAGVSQTWSSASYEVQRPIGPMAERGTLRPVYGQSWPITALDRFDAVTVLFRAGYGVDPQSVPMALRQAMLLMLDEWYDPAWHGRAMKAALEQLQPYINRPVCYA